MTLRLIVLTYLALVIVLLASFFALAVFADTARMQHDWIGGASAALLDITQVTVGAAVGSLTTAAGAIAKRSMAGD